MYNVAGTMEAHKIEDDGPYQRWKTKNNIEIEYYDLGPTAMKLFKPNHNIQSNTKKFSQFYQ